MSQYNSRTELALTFWILQKRWEAEGNEGYLPWKYDGVFFKGHHSFDWVLDKYEIPVSILAGMPVWLGDIAYNEMGEKRIAKQDGWHKENIGNMCDFGDEEPNNYTWTPPAKVETPTKTCGCYDKIGYDCSSMSGNEKKTDYTYTWDSPTLVKKTIKIYGWVNPHTGATFTTDSDVYLGNWIRFPKLDDEVEV